MSQIISVEQIDSLVEECAEFLEKLSRNYWWSWASNGEYVYKVLDEEVWHDSNHNPVLFLRRIGQEPIRKLLLSAKEARIDKLLSKNLYKGTLSDTESHEFEAEGVLYLNVLRDLYNRFKMYMEQKITWASKNFPSLFAKGPIAYFCAEFGFHESMMIYSGGLGILAGDHLKSASDLGIPLIGIGMLYRQGYFIQKIGADGYQTEKYEDANFENLPLELQVNSEEEPIKIEIMVRQRPVMVQCWKCQVGRISLYLLDTNLPENQEVDQWLTAHLYGGDKDTRFNQETLLGIGGVKMLRALNISPSLFHMNEGHSGFLTVELIREMENKGVSFEDAQKEIKKQCLFTTHTPVAAGNDSFSQQFILDMLEYKEPLQAGSYMQKLLNLGTRQADDFHSPFEMSVLGIRLSKSTNGVSKKHGEVVRDMWGFLRMADMQHQYHFTHVTNGVHLPTWRAAEIGKLVQEHLYEIPLDELLQVKQRLKERLITMINSKAAMVCTPTGAQANLDPNILTIGFARRFASYKRGALLFYDLERLKAIINDSKRPVQFVFAGKAHPKDDKGKKVFQRLADAAKEVSERIVVLENYNIYQAKALVQGVDVWLNTPARFLEASGTSGMKAAINGTPNMSVLDGWWKEGYMINHAKNGWAIGEHLIETGDPNEDKIDAESIYTLLETEVGQMYYEDKQAWAKIMREPIASCSPAFSSDRMLKEYTDLGYQ
jgi:glycogen phosphorylase